MNREAVVAAMRGLNAVRRGEVFEPHKVRDALRRARLLEERLGRIYERMYQARRKAEDAFCEGWPHAKDAPWRIE